VHVIALDEEVVQRIQSLGLERMLNLLAAIPGLGHDSAVAILAEVGPDMNQFPTAKQLSSWAGVCPGNKKSAGKNFSGHTTRGNRWLRSTLTECAWAVSRSKKSALRDKVGQEEIEAGIVHAEMGIHRPAIPKPE
jgi:transposase